ncbi:MAG: alpha/beta fold hydrolase [Actinomycetota bacterium]|nr:alpha/beta fold hydrolase [Actinomycetota bacterium]
MTGAQLAAIEAEVRPGPTRATVVLVPGYTGSKEDFVGVLQPLVDEGYHVLAVDQLGQHESTHAGETSRYAVDALARDVLDVVAGLGRPVHLLGHSFGGLVARAAVLASPSAVRSLTLLGSGPAALPSARADRLRLLLPALGQLSLEQIWVAMRDLDADAGLPRPPAAVEAFLHRRFVGNDPAALWVMGHALLDEPDRTQALRETGLPVHVCYGEADDAWLPATQASMAQHLAAAHTVVPGAAHSPAAENPEATAKILTAFWSDVDADSERDGASDSPSR